MLGIGRQHGRCRCDEPGADQRVLGGQRRRAIQRSEAGRGVHLGRADLGAARVRGAGARGQRFGASVCGADDGVAPGLGVAADRRVSPDGACEIGGVSTHEIRHALHGWRHSAAGLRGQSAWQLERSGDPADFGARAAFERLARISSAQIYRFRNSAAYGRSNATCQPTRPTVIAIGARRKPQPQGMPGFLRIGKGIYQINAVDEVTQWEIAGAVPQISESWLIPLHETMLVQFPFRIRGFHSDNGSEFINYTVQRLLNKLVIEQTKSRASLRSQRIGGSQEGGRHRQTHWLRSHRHATGRSCRPISWTLRGTADADRTERHKPSGLPAVGHTIRVAAGSAALRRLLALWPDAGRTRPLRSATIRYQGRAIHATRLAPTHAPHRQTQCLIDTKLRAPERCGNAGSWTSVENAPALPTFPQRRRFLLASLNKNERPQPHPPSPSPFRLILR